MFIDLHLHLDGSLSLETVKRLLVMENIPVEKSDEELMKLLKVDNNCRDLNQYLEKFDFPLSLLQTEESITYAVYALQEELIKKGCIYAEIRFAPQLHTNKALTQEKVVEAAIKGLEMSELDCGLILCCMRMENNTAENMKTAQTALKYLNKGVCALDLAGAEELYSTDRFEYIFSFAGENNIPFTIHAGEAAGPESIYKALEFGAKRIGHGVMAMKDKALMKKLSKEGITLELCPTSNLNTGIFEHIDQYPIKMFMDKNICVTVNSDNMTVSDTDAGKEIDILKNVFYFDDNTVKQLLLNSAESAFAPEDIKEKFKKRILAEFL